MDYTLTYTLGDWESTDTIVVYVNMTGVEAGVRWYDDKEVLKKILVSYGVEKKDATYILNKGLYFIRNCADTDYELYLHDEMKGEKK